MVVSLEIKKSQTGKVIRKIENLTAAEQTHLVNQVLDPNPEHEYIEFD